MTRAPYAASRLVSGEWMQCFIRSWGILKGRGERLRDLGVGCESMRKKKEKKWGVHPGECGNGRSQTLPFEAIQSLQNKTHPLDFSGDVENSKFNLTRNSGLAGANRISEPRLLLIHRMCHVQNGALRGFLDETIFGSFLFLCARYDLKICGTIDV